MTNRLENLRKNMPAQVDGVLITSSIDRKYFTGLKSSAGVLLVTRDSSYFIVDFRYIEVAKNIIKGSTVVLQENLTEQLQQLANKHNLKNIGIESGYLTVADFQRYQDIFNQSQLIATNELNGIITEMRRYKTVEEVEAIKTAQSFAEKAFLDILDFIKPGKTEREVAARLEYVMKSNGSSAPSFGSIVAAGKNSSMPHAVPSENVISTGDFVTMDFGATYDSYCSDMTRTVAVGTITEEMHKVYDTVLDAQLQSLSAIRVGANCMEVDKVARDIIANAGYGENFGHSLGHAVGLEVHEAPGFSTKAEKEVCKPGYVMTVEPGIYLPGRFGVRIEDMVFITEQGPVNLTKSEKKLITL